MRSCCPLAVTWIKGINLLTFRRLLHLGGNIPYILVLLKKSWSEALEYCRNLHKDLFSVLNPDHNQMLANKLHDRQLDEAWIGLYRGVWQWLDGTAASLRLWAPMEPNNDSTEGCAAMYRGSWYDTACDQKLDFVCLRKFRFCRCDFFPHASYETDLSITALGSE